MYEKTIQQMFDQFGQFGEPVRRLSEVAMEQAEKVAHHQLDSARVYVDLGLEQLRAASEVRDAKALQGYIDRQQDIAARFGRQVTDDVETLAGFGRELSEATTTVSRKANSSTKGGSGKAAA
ncbi:phasin family protein [Arhodomonas sp. SL1]|uniref:phasin family protein n=1 Tax=Arhodomonas sp. SL1 TaxID=3425691 RepID=UPI003F8822AB